MAQTNILSSITRTGSYPLSTSLTAGSNCGTMSISLTGTWDRQMISELPTINFSVFMADGTKLVSVDFDMTTFTSDKGSIDVVEPYTMALYDLPEEFTLKVTPIFDKNAIASHNAQIEAGDVTVFNTSNTGIVDTNTSDYSALLWTTPTTTFNMTITFDDANISSGGGGGGSSSADQVVFVPPADMTSTDVQSAIEELDTKINDLPEPMIFKGSLGTGGTITTLPTASDANKGFTYKVITAGTYQGVTAEIGDTLISDGTTWVLIPSGDEPSGTVTNVAVSSTDGSMTITGSPITSSGTIGIKLNAASKSRVGGIVVGDGLSVNSVTGAIVCDTGYYFDSPVTCTLNGNQRQKYNSDPAIGIIVSFLGGAYCNPIFISPTQEGCYTDINMEVASSVVYGGITWYYSKLESGVSGVYPDSEGNMLSYPNDCTWDDSIRSISTDTVLAILAYVHAQVTTTDGVLSVDVDDAFDADSTNPVQNAILTELVTPMTQAEYDLLSDKDMPLYFIYEQ